MSDHTPECVQMIIGYVTDPVPDYVTAIRAAKSLEELKRAISDYRLIAADALASAANLQESDWTEVQGFIKSGGRGKFASEAMLSKYGAILLPEIMLRVSMIAEHFGAPWGCAYIRCRDEGHIEERDGIAVWASK